MRDLSAVIDEKTGMVEVSWHPENSSTQDSYKLQYHEVETTIGGDSNMLTTDKTKVRERERKRVCVSFILTNDSCVFEHYFLYQFFKNFSFTIQIIYPS